MRQQRRFLVGLSLFTGLAALAGQLSGLTLSAGLALALPPALLLWMATGNVIAPGIAWMAVAALTPMREVIAVLPPAALAVHLALVRERPVLRRTRVVPARPLAAVPASLDPEDLPRLRLLLDRALQPIARFRGFDQLDQYQTAALRYQVNFIAYALALAQARYLPAYRGHLAEAQRRLLAKLGEPVVWFYWRREALWGHLALKSDPIARDNIMYSGFAALQIGLTGGGDLRLNGKAGDEIACHTPRDLGNALRAQYETAPLGLVACEPGWVYPLCNAITASGLAALDSEYRTGNWPAIRDRFAHHLGQDFTTESDRILPLRSSVTGFALPPVGGVVPEAMTSLFLNPVLPDFARMHWERIASRLRQNRWRRDVWPVDTGNYRISRAASIAGTAAAAAEFGDTDLRDGLLDWLDDLHPASHVDGSCHRHGVSLWAHAVEVMARLGDQNLLAQAVTRRKARPALEAINWPEVEVLSAHQIEGELRLTLWSEKPALARMTIQGRLVSHPVDGRTELSLKVQP